MPKFINVPQGRSAILIHRKSNPEIDGLFTNGFSTCNILAFINSDKIALLHYDFRTQNSAIQDIYTVMGAGTRLIIFHREMGVTSKERIENYVKTQKLQLNYEFIILPKTQDGICVYLQPQEALTIHPQIRVLPTSNLGEVGVIAENELKNAEMLYHPQERQFLAVRKMEQMIGVKARHAKIIPKTNRYELVSQEIRKGRVSQHQIYDGEYWLAMENESIIDDSHPMTKEELQFLKKYNVAYIKIAGAIGGLFQSLGTMVSDDIKDSVMNIAFWTEDYLCIAANIDNERILRRNLLDMVNDPKNNPDSNDAKEFANQFRQLLLANASPTKLEKFIQPYSQKISDKNYFYRVCNEFDTCYRHYNARQVYVESQQLLARKRKAFNCSYDEAMKATKEQDYNKALTLFQRSFELAHEVFFKNDNKFPEICYRIAICFFKLGMTEEAKLEISACESLMNDASSKNFRKQVKQLRNEVEAIDNVVVSEKSLDM